METGLRGAPNNGAGSPPPYGLGLRSHTIGTQRRRHAPRGRTPFPLFARRQKAQRRLAETRFPADAPSPLRCQTGFAYQPRERVFLVHVDQCAGQRRLCGRHSSISNTSKSNGAATLRPVAPGRTPPSARPTHTTTRICPVMPR